MAKAPAKKTKKKAASAKSEEAVRIRMYRQGHGDCYLLTFPRKGGGPPVRMLIDCGAKRGSQVEGAPDWQQIHDDIRAETGGKLDVVVMTHEHDDHLNGFTAHFDSYEIGEAWMAWTEDPADSLADELRRRHGDQLKALQGLMERHGARTDPEIKSMVEALLDLETSGPAFAAGGRRTNKDNMKTIKDRAQENRGCRFFSPHRPPHAIPGVDGVQVYVLGPPRDAGLLKDEDPKGDSAFPRGKTGLASAGSLLFAAGDDIAEDDALQPFARRFRCDLETALGSNWYPAYFAQSGAPVPKDGADSEELGAAWRRIDDEWTNSVAEFALKLNAGINNTSLVLAFELPKSKKVLLFAADAQNGNWRSWAEAEFRTPGGTVTARELLARTVLYKVGHHGSHNATLMGTEASGYANLAWMGHGAAAEEFCAMINAVPTWATEKAHWEHPLPSIKEALMKKAENRVFQTEEQGGELKKPDSIAASVWARFESRAILDNPLYFELAVEDD